MVFNLYWRLVIVLFCDLRFSFVDFGIDVGFQICCFAFVWFAVVYVFVAYCLGVRLVLIVGFVLIVLVLCFFVFRFMVD